jgi:hypothetical protein
MLYVKDAYIGYYDEYIVLGLTPHFKKIPRDNNHESNLQSGNPLTSPQSFMDRFMTNLYKLTETMTQPFRKHDETLQDSLLQQESQYE